MKKLIYILMALAILVGCEKQEQGQDGNQTINPGNKPDDKPDDKPVKDPSQMTFTEKITGEWHCTPSDIKADIYINFAEDGNFELYQQITEGAHRLYRGTWKVEDETQRIISGKYNDGESWASNYIVNLSEDISSMSLAPTVLTADGITYEYKREEIPAEIKETCEIKVKSPYAY